MRFAHKRRSKREERLGIGRACAMAFAREGAKVAVLDWLTEMGLEDGGAHP